MNAAVVEFTGLYGQKVTLRARDIVHVIAHRVWTEVMVIGGTTYKVLESGDEVDARTKAALRKGEAGDESVDVESSGKEDTDCAGKDACDIPGMEEAKA